MKHQAILDFSDDGKAVVQIPDVGKMAFINMFGFSPISEVERDIEQAEPERKRFLEKYLQIYKEMYGENHQTDENAEKAIEKLHDAYTTIMPVIETSFRAYNDYDNEYKYDDAINVLSDDEFLCVEESLDDYGINNLIVNNIKLAHSSAWYLMGHVNADIESTTKQLELTKGKLLFFNQFKVVARILEKDLPTFDDQVKEIMESCKMTREQTKYCLGLPTNELAKFNVNETEKEILSIEKRLSLLKRLL